MWVPEEHTHKVCTEYGKFMQTTNAHKARSQLENRNCLVLFFKHFFLLMAYVICDHLQKIMAREITLLPKPWA